MDGWIIAFLIIFMLHNLEEIIMVEKWHLKTYPKVKNKIPMFINKELSRRKITSIGFAVVVFVLSIIVSALIFISVMTEQYYLYLGVSLPFAINIFSHPLQSLYLKCYTPGVLTSIVLIIPYYFLFFHQFYQTELFSLDSVLRAIVVIVFLVPAFFLSHKVGERWS